MTTYNTGNPVGSAAVKDLYDNAENLDLLSVGTASAYPDRLGVSRKSWRGFEQDFAQFLLNSGFEIPVPYAAGIAVSRPTQLFIYQGEVYRAKPESLPFTSTTWANDSAKMVATGDSALRQQLASASGSTLIGYGDRTVSAKFAERRSVKDFGAKGDGVTDDTVAIQAAFNAGVGRFTEGEFIASRLNGVNGLVITGEGFNRTTIKRKANEGSNNPLLFCNNVNGWSIEGVHFDGNKPAQSVPTNTVLVQGCYNWDIYRCSFTRAKGQGGSYGAGLMILNGTNLNNLTTSSVRESQCVSNDGHGLALSKDGFVKIQGLTSVANGLDGIGVTNFSNPPPTSATERDISILDSTCMYNLGSGIDVGGYVDAYTASGLPINGGNRPTAFDVTISRCHLKRNRAYGLVFQSSNGNISHNHINENGSDTTNGGALLNMTQSVFDSNQVHDNYFYGADAGGATSSLFSGNMYNNNGGLSGSGCTALNVSAGVGNMIDGDIYYNNGDATGGVAINVRGFDGGTDPVFPTKTSQLSIKNVKITQLNGNTYGINCSDGTKNISLDNNDVYGGNPDRAYAIGATVLAGRGNKTWTNDTWETVVASNLTTVFPDLAEELTITGIATVNNLYTYSRNYFDGKVERVEVGSGGSGYTPAAQIPLTFTGGGGSGAAGYGIVNNAGAIAGVTLTSLGSGYTSAPAVAPSIAPPSGTISMAASINMNNTEGRRILIYLSGSATLTSNGNMRLTSNFTGNGQKFIELMGKQGVWFEVSRSA